MIILRNTMMKINQILNKFKTHTLSLEKLKQSSNDNQKKTK